MKYNQAPLPFQGQKRMFLKDFSEVIKLFPKDGTFVDLFGGSGLLSHTIKEIHPEATVIWNDYDNYMQRLKHIPTTNQILQELREVVKGYPLEKKLSESMQKKCVKILEKYQKKGFVDVATLSSSLVFSGRRYDTIETIKNVIFYNNIKKTDYPLPVGYLKGVQRVSMCYKKLLPKLPKNSVFILDPPYLSTDVAGYRDANFWQLKDYLDILDIIGKNYIYFTSEKSDLPMLMEWVRKKTGGQFFNKIQRKERKQTTNYSGKYTDIMLYSIG